MQVLVTVGLFLAILAVVYLVSRGTKSSYANRRLVQQASGRRHAVGSILRMDDVQVIRFEQVKGDLTTVRAPYMYHGQVEVNGPLTYVFDEGVLTITAPNGVIAYCGPGVRLGKIGITGDHYGDM